MSDPATSEYQKRLAQLRSRAADLGKFAPEDIQWLLDNVSEVDIASDTIDWSLGPAGDGRVIFEMRSSVKPTTWLAMYIDREIWQRIKAAGDKQLGIAESLPAEWSIRIVEALRSFLMHPDLGLSETQRAKITQLIRTQLSIAEPSVRYGGGGGSNGSAVVVHG